MINFFTKPKYSSDNFKDISIPNLYTKCPITGELIYNKTLEKNLMVAPCSGYHFPLTAKQRIKLLIDNNSFKETDSSLRSLDPLKFKATDSYKNKLKQNQEKTQMTEAVVSGTGNIKGIKVSFAVMDFRFLGASMGSVVGEKITRCIERGVDEKLPVVIVSASGGARMYEGIISLMQMAKTSAALAKLRESRLPFISVLTHPTMAGVMASFASLGDLIISEPGATIGFAGQRVIQATTKQVLPKNFQTAEFLLEHGFLDQIVTRQELKKRISFFLKALMKIK